MSWERSASVSKVLLTGRARQQELISLAYKELVVRGTLVPSDRKRRFGTEHWLTPTTGGAELPVELRPLQDDLLRLAPDGGTAQQVISRMGLRSKAHQRWGTQVRDLVVAQGLVTRQPRRLLGFVPAGTRLVATPSGLTARAELEALLAEAAAHAALPAVLLLSARGTFPEIDRALAPTEGAFLAIDSSCGDGDGGGDGGGD